MDNNNLLRKVDLLISERRLKRHLYNISLFRCVDRLYSNINESCYQILKNITDGLLEFPQQEWCYYTLDFLYNELNQATYLWNTYKEYIISDVSILKRAKDYIDMLHQSYLLFIQIYDHYNPNEFYIHYLYEKSNILTQEINQYEL